MGAQQPRSASCSLSVSPYITTRRCNSPAGPGLGPHKTSSSRPASNLAHFNIRQIWTISTPVNRHFPFYFHHTTTVSSRQPFLGPHERSTCYVSGSLPISTLPLAPLASPIPHPSLLCMFHTHLLPFSLCTLAPARNPDGPFTRIPFTPLRSLGRMTPSLYTTALGPLCHRTFDHFTSRPLRSGRVPAPAPCFGRPGPLHITSPPFRPGPCARALLRLARLLHYHVPSVQAGSLRPRPDSDSLDSNHVPLIRPAHIVRPGFSRALGSHPGPGLCSQRPRARDTGARTPDTTTEPSSACAFPTPQKRQLWTCWSQHPAGAGTFHAGDAGAD